VERSEVLVFATDEAQWAPPPELRIYAQAAQEVLRQPQHQADPLSPAAIQAYFEALYWQKGEQALDAQDLLGLLRQSRLDNLPFEHIAHQFQMIQSAQQPVVIAWDDTADHAIEALRHSDTVGGLARQLQPYLVQVPRQAFAALRQAGAIQPIAPERWGEQFMALVNMDIYSPQYGLWWDEPTFVDAAQLIV
ncbi:MAG: CRISPR-associated helicase/endonuclease Cas3, partial [Comamonadaceae bacterium]|nr:CRISPR-associated helicase/endonuclease Cas3 [Comamonadaceae bacterium]